ncbi:hypothetical protein L1987_43304 [Smallanthus sonchifolius]|uniref:Uncharacterized protein n=1 Tax=Smallanthus sonchifolius TaxID=185202 RepID=A0ACB9GKQ4_9ASTR|nr:hypothetical protein L1987_43304 [Smallanthus sonchifolius]
MHKKLGRLVVLRKAAQQRLMEKEKNKGPSCAMGLSFKLKKVAWSMLLDGKAISEIEINDMIYDFDRDYKDIGVARITIKYCVVKNCLPNAKSDTLLAAWNPPSEWGKKVMIRVDEKTGAPKDGVSTIELFQADVYPLKIHLSDTVYRMMWGYFFLEEEQDSHLRQEVWKVSTTAGLRRGKKGNEATKELEGASKPNMADPLVELLVTYEGPRFAVSDLRLLMDSFHRVEFTGTWKKLFARVQKHVIWSVLKSVTGMQGKKFKDKSMHAQNKEPNLENVPTLDPESEGDGDGDGAGDGFVTSVKGLFSTQQHKAKAFVLRTMRNEGEEAMPWEWSDGEDYSPFARQLTITKMKQLIRRHTKDLTQENVKLFVGFSVSSSSPRGHESDSSGGDPFEVEVEAAQDKTNK